MLFIEKQDKVPLPKKFHEQHNLCVVLYDSLVDILKKPRYRNLKSTRIPLDSESKRIVERIDKGGIHILDYLENNQRRNEIITVLTKHVFTSVLFDMTSFIYESLSCAKKGKMSVAYTLLRKPLTDELLLLEQILIDRDDFIDRFYFRGDSNSYDPSVNKIGQERIREVISSAINKLGMISPLFNDVIFDVRYNKASMSGLNGIMNHAHHIVTSDKNYKTENKNLNFVFSNREDIDKYWDHYYYYVPYLLAYCTYIVDKIAHDLTNVNTNYKASRELKRYLSILFWRQRSSSKGGKSVQKLFDHLGKQLIVTCPCGSESKFIKADFKLFVQMDIFLCSKCFNNLLVSTDLPTKICNYFSNKE